MASTKITYKMVYIAPHRGGLDENDQPIDYSELIEHPDGSRVEVVGVDHTGGGAEKLFLAHVLIIEPVKP